MMKIRYLQGFSCLVFMIGLFLFPMNSNAIESFPVYPSIKPNIAFWKKIFTEYTTTQGVMHDCDDLRIIYDVIRLESPESRNSDRINKERVEKITKKYKAVLEKLAKGHSPSTPDETRVFALFGSGASRKDFQKASENIRCQTGLSDRFKKSIIRSGAYIDEIKRIFRSYGLPEDLSYLPHVESSFNSNAYSKAGAAGIWQFTRSTGRLFMEVSYTVDERWDPIRASDAAARLLRESYRILGNWPMALTAYNHGVAGMSRAKKKMGGYEEIFNGYKSRTFKFASRNFYSEFLAALDVAGNAKRYFGDLPIEKPIGVNTRVLVLKNYVSLKELAHYLNIDEDVIRSLNLSLRGPVHRGEKYIPKNYALRLPANRLKEAAIKSADLPDNLYKPKQKRTRFYQVQRGDTAGEIAERHGVKLSDLIIANNLDSRATIYVGANLRIPGETPLVPQKKKARPVQQKTSIAKSEKVVMTAESRPATVPVENPGSIEAGGMQFNDDIVIGNFLVENVNVKDGIRIGVIQVEVEETLGHYADWLNIATNEIRKLNGFPYDREIRLHDRLKIPLGDISKELFEERRFEYHKKLQEDFFASYRVKDVESYQIKNGDNLWTLCQDVFEIPFWLFYKYNPQTDIRRLDPSKKVNFPRIEEINKT